MNPSDNEKHLHAFRENGYTVFEGVFDDTALRGLRETIDALTVLFPDRKTGNTPWFGNTLSYASEVSSEAAELLWAGVSNPVFLDFAESVLGPFVQLDNLTIAAMPSVTPEEAAGKINGWHRDRFGKMVDIEGYQAPLAMNFIFYGQDLTDEYGPLRVIPGSHRKPVAVPEEDRLLPHPDEVVLRPKAGDVAAVANNLLHSGTPNTSGKPRYFMSFFYSVNWLRTTDDHSAAFPQQLRERAKAAGDLRALRLPGEDAKRTARANCGFRQPSDQLFQKWLAEEKEQHVAI